MGTLKQKLEYINATKTAIKDAIIAKGQPISDSDTFRSYVDKINAISGGGGGKVDVGAIGFKCGHSTFSEIPNELDFHNVTDMSNMFSDCNNLTSVDLPHTENVTSTGGMFSGCYSLVSADLPHTENVTDMNNMFNSCYSLVSANIPHTEACTNMNNMFQSCYNLASVNLPHTEACTNMSWMFYGCNELTSVSIGDISQVTDTSYMFGECYKLNDITLGGNPASITNTDSMFTGLPETGVFAYDYRYDYSQIISLLPQGWKSKANYTPTACSELTIIADNIDGQETQTIIHYTAVTTGEPAELGTVIVKGDAPFEVGTNPNPDASRQVEVSFTYLGQTATTTITQYKYSNYGTSTLDPNSDGAAEARQNRYLTEFSTTDAVENINYTNSAPIPGGKNYVRVSGQQLSVNPGQTVNFHIKANDNADGLQYCNMKMWIDWNCVGEYSHPLPRPGYSFPDGWDILPEDPEGMLAWMAGRSRDAFEPFQTGYDFTITVPDDAKEGTSRLRMVFNDAWFGGSLLPTGLTAKGYTIDIDVQINASITPEPTDNIRVSVAPELDPGKRDIRIAKKTADGSYENIISYQPELNVREVMVPTGTELRITADKKFTLPEQFKAITANGVELETVNKRAYYTVDTDTEFNIATTTETRQATVHIEQPVEGGTLLVSDFNDIRTPIEDGTQVWYGQIVALQYEKQQGYRFVNFTANGNPIEETPGLTAYTINEDTTFGIVFEKTV